MNKYVEEFRSLVLSKYLDLRFFLIKKIVGKDPVIMNIHVTSDIIKFNKLERNKRVVFHNNTVKTVSDRQSFVYSGNTRSV